MSRTSISSELVIRLNSNLSFLKLGRPTICYCVCLSCQKPKFDQLFCLSCLNLRDENRREKKRREEKRRVDEQQEAKFGPYNQYILYILYDEINFIQAFQKLEGHSVSSFYISKCTISDFKNREKSINSYFQNSIELHKNKNLFTSPNYWMTRESMG